jgi:hypothetical protein
MGGGHPRTDSPSTGAPRSNSTAARFQNAEPPDAGFTNADFTDAGFTDAGFTDADAPNAGRQNTGSADLGTGSPSTDTADTDTDTDTDTGTGPPVERPTPGQQRADAFTQLCSILLANGQLPDNGGDRPQLTVTIDLRTLQDQIGTATLDTGETISPTTARRLACDAAIIPAILNGPSQILDLGRERRLFTGPLRRALILRDRGCAFPTCDRPPRWTEAHHIQPWADGGPTNLTNGVLLCRHHHRLLHHHTHNTADTWQVQINPNDGLPEFTPPAYIDPRQQPRRNRYHHRE